MGLACQKLIQINSKIKKIKKLTLVGVAVKHNPTLLTLFESVLGLSCQPDPVALDSAAKPASIAFGGEGNASSHNY